ncbi:MAG TPA: hypothetical protein VEF04_05385 [Blastocatellia bacterium]|nr:hypothetical protein [Blastocatellia bacterium]
MSFVVLLLAHEAFAQYPPALILDTDSSASIDRFGFYVNANPAARGFKTFQVDEFDTSRMSVTYNKPFESLTRADTFWIRAVQKDASYEKMTTFKVADSAGFYVAYVAVFLDNSGGSTQSVREVQSKGIALRGNRLIIPVSATERNCNLYDANGRLQTKLTVPAGTEEICLPVDVRGHYFLTMEGQIISMLLEP